MPHPCPIQRESTVPGGRRTPQQPLTNLLVRGRLRAVGVGFEPMVTSLPRQFSRSLSRRRPGEFAEGSGAVVTGWPSRLALVDDIGSVAEAGGGAARHTRA